MVSCLVMLICKGLSLINPSNDQEDYGLVNVEEAKRQCSAMYQLAFGKPFDESQMTVDLDRSPAIVTIHAGEQAHISYRKLDGKFFGWVAPHLPLDAGEELDDTKLINLARAYLEQTGYNYDSDLAVDRRDRVQGSPVIQVSGVWRYGAYNADTMQGYIILKLDKVTGAPSFITVPRRPNPPNLKKLKLTKEEATQRIAYHLSNKHRDRQLKQLDESRLIVHGIKSHIGQDYPSVLAYRLNIGDANERGNVTGPRSITTNLINAETGEMIEDIDTDFLGNKTYNGPSDWPETWDSCALITSKKSIRIPKGLVVKVIETRTLSKDSGFVLQAGSVYQYVYYDRNKGIIWIDSGAGKLCGKPNASLKKTLDSLR